MDWIKKILLRYVSGEKDEQVLTNMLATLVIKGGALLIALYTMPAYIRYFENQTVLGLWFTILAVITWILSFDFGIGNGLRNKLVGAFLRKDEREIREYISSAYAIIAGIVFIITVFGLAVASKVNWNWVFRLSPSLISPDVMLFTVRVIFSGVMIQFLLRLIFSIFYAMQKSAVPNLLALLTSILQLMFILFAPSYGIENNLKMLSVVFSASVNIPLIIATIIVFQAELNNYWPSIRFFNWSKALSVLSLGGVFFWCQIMFMLITTTNEFLITQFSGPEYVVEYQIYNKLFTLIGSLLMLALTPMWSSITKAVDEIDTVWLNRTYKLLNRVTLLTVLLEFLLIPFLQVLINLWLAESTITVNYFYAVVFAIYGSIYIYVSVLGTIVCGTGKLTLQSVMFPLAVIIKFILTYVGMNFYNSWITVLIVNILVLFPYVILQPRYITNDIANLSKSLN